MREWSEWSNLPVQNNLSPLANTPNIMGTLRSAECPRNIERITSSKTFSLGMVYSKPLGGKSRIVKLVREMKKKIGSFTWAVLYIYRENKPCPLAAMNFWQIQTAWTILVEDHQKNISAKFYGNRSSGLGQDDFYIFLYIGKISPAPWRPCFLTNPNDSNNLGRGSLKEHFFKIIWKSVQWFLTGRFLKFSI